MRSATATAAARLRAPSLRKAADDGLRTVIRVLDERGGLLAGDREVEDAGQ